MTGQKKYENLRKQNPVFIYESFSINDSSNEIVLEFQFRLSDSVIFRPFIRIPKNGIFPELIEKDTHFQNIVFHIGLIELVSYWKLCCSPQVIIRAAYLNEEQIIWLEHLYYNGMGEFFYINGISAEKDDFMQIKVESGKQYFIERIRLNEEYIVPVGGGKDSAVTLELLKTRSHCTPFALNPRKAIEDCIKAGGFKSGELIRFYRSLDPLMLEMNTKEYLNGHTPFSALLAFISLAAAYLWKKKYIMLSNEASASEPTIPGTNINHQYSKSFEFETNFREYYKKHISTDYEYLSFLRPLNELQIARLFSGFRQYHSVFRSCNIGSKEDKWCGKCSKCLFAAIILSPFLKDEELEKIFGYNILDNLSLIDDFEKLSGIAEEKPFECIGTLEEVNIALCEAIRQRESAGLPLLLDKYRNFNQYNKYKDKSFAIFIDTLDTNHYLDEELFVHLKNRYYESPAC